MNSKLSPG